jgi:hypothetical protein
MIFVLEVVAAMLVIVVGMAGWDVRPRNKLARQRRITRERNLTEQTLWREAHAPIAST